MKAVSELLHWKKKMKKKKREREEKIMLLPSVTGLLMALEIIMSRYRKGAFFVLEFKIRLLVVRAEIIHRHFPLGFT